MARRGSVRQVGEYGRRSEVWSQEQGKYRIWSELGEKSGTALVDRVSREEEEE